MKFYKDYHFYVALSAFVVLVIGLLTDYFGIFIDSETITTILSYLLSILIAFNVININIDKNKTIEEIKEDINKTSTDMQDKINSAKQNTENEKEIKQTKKREKTISKIKNV